MNQIQLVGNLGRDPELRHTSNKTAVANFSLATRGKEGAAVWHQVTAWGKTAEFCSSYFRKGSSVWVSGELQYKTYTDKSGAEKTVAFVSTNRVGFAGNKSENQTSGGSGDSTANHKTGLEDLPDAGGDLRDEDIPF